VTRVLVLTAVDVESRTLARHLGLTRDPASQWPHFTGGALELATVGVRASRLTERAQRFRPHDLVVSAGACGALAPELSAGELVVPQVVVVCVPFIVALAQRFIEDRGVHTASDARRRLAQGFAAFGAAMAIGFFGASPYILIDWSRFVNDVSGVGTHLAQGHGMVLGRGWWYYARVVLPAAIGWPMFVAGVCGVIVLFAKRFRDAAVLLGFPVAYYLIAGQGYTVFARYVLPLLPFLSVSAAWLVVSLGRTIARQASPVRRAVVVTALAMIVAAPTAYKTLQLDRLLATTDNRIVVARALAEILPPDSVLYQSGEKYGYVPTTIDGHVIARISRYDEGSGTFDSGEPDWILVQRSPLVLYSAVPPGLDRIVREQYELVRRFPTGRDDHDRIYDQQDALYLPLDGFSGLERPGPAFELYHKAPTLLSR